MPSKVKKTVKRPVNRQVAVKKVVRKEIRMHDRKNVEVYTSTLNTGLSLGIPASTGLVISMQSALTRGTGGTSQFSGKFVKPIGLQINCAFSAGDTENLVRMIIVQYKDGTIPTSITDILNNSAAADVSSCLAQFNINTNQNFRILYNKIIPVSQATGVVTRRIFLKKFIPIEYFSNTLAIQKGGIYMFLQSDSTVSPDPTLRYHSRLYYTDQ